jgi:hypothetical protein
MRGNAASVSASDALAVGVRGWPEEDEGELVKGDADFVGSGSAKFDELPPQAVRNTSAPLATPIIRRFGSCMGSPEGWSARAAGRDEACQAHVKKKRSTFALISPTSSWPFPFASWNMMCEMAEDPWTSTSTVVIGYPRPHGPEG